MPHLKSLFAESPAATTVTTTANLPCHTQRVLHAQTNLISLHAPSLTTTIKHVTLPTGDYINVLFATSSANNPTTNTTTSNKKTLVLIHGWGAGLAFHSKILDQLATADYNLVLIDLLGMGGSSRPKYPRNGDIDESTQFFVESLHHLFQALEDDSEVLLAREDWYLVGHSLGAYLSAEYCLKYPGHVKGLVLISPAGMIGRPGGVQEFMSDLTWGKRMAFKTMVKLWEANVTPQGIMRGFGRKLTTRFCLGYVTKRFEGLLSEEECKAYGQYLCEISLGPGSGEYAVNALLEPFAWAKRPLVDRLNGLQCATMFIYGEEGKDWMDWRGAEKAVKNMVNVPTMIAQVKDAGHFVFIDNPMGCTEAILEACRMFEEKSMREDGIFETEDVRVYE